MPPPPMAKTPLLDSILPPQGDVSLNYRFSSGTAALFWNSDRPLSAPAAVVNRDSLIPPTPKLLLGLSPVSCRLTGIVWNTSSSALWHGLLVQLPADFFPLAVSWSYSFFFDLLFEQPWIPPRRGRRRPFWCWFFVDPFSLPLLSARFIRL